jgi:hypothetical protein
MYGNSLLNETSKKKMFYPYGYAISEEKRKQDPSNTKVAQLLRSDFVLPVQTSDF